MTGKIYSICLCLFLWTNLIPAYSQEEGAALLLIDSQDTTRVDLLDEMKEGMGPLYLDPRLPAFTVVSRNRKVAFGMGGYIRLAASQDVAGIMNNRDFLINDIPMSYARAQRSRFLMDIGTSRLFAKILADTKFGRLQMAFDTDFRASSNGFRYSAIYFKLNGFLLGRYWTVMGDLDGYPPSIDYQGPNAFIGTSTYQISYQGTLYKKLSFGAGLEIPVYSIPDSLSNFKKNQTIPTLPIYLQYGSDWGHVRIASLLRPLYYKNTLNEKSEIAFTWGAVFSSCLKPVPPLTIYLQGVYGKGICEYVFDLSGYGMDLFPNPDSPGKLKPHVFYGGLGGLKYQFTPKFSASTIFSQLRLMRNGLNDPTLYRFGQYMTFTLYYKLTPKFEIATEYDHGRKVELSMDSGRANRLQIAFRYDF